MPREWHVEPGEFSRFLRAVKNREWWQPYGEPQKGWRMEVTHARSFVRPHGTHGEWLAAVQVMPSKESVLWTVCPNEHEAKRTAERVIEEHRPNA